MIDSEYRRSCLGYSVMVGVLCVVGLAPRVVTASPCPSDCDLDAAVSWADVMRGVEISLDQSPAAQCTTMDRDGDGHVSVEEVVGAVYEAGGACVERAAAAAASAAHAALKAAEEAENMLEDISYVRNPAAARGASGSQFARRASEGLCAQSGSVSGSCVVSGGLSRFRTRYDSCTDIDSDNGDRVTLNGELELVIEDPTACAAGDAVANRTYEVRDRNFELREVDFHRVLRNSAGVRRQEHRANVTQRFVAAGTGCAGPNGTTWYDGSLEVFDAAEDVDGSYQYRGVSLAVTSEGNPCLVRKSKSGTIRAESKNHDERFTERTKDFTITEQTLDQDTRSVSLAGDLDVDCLGAMRIETVQPLRFQRGVQCPRSGILGLTLRDNRFNGVRFTTQGAQGEVELDFDYVIDRSNCGPGQNCGFVRDTAVPSCLDESLDRCRIVMPPNPELGFCDPAENQALRFDGDDVVSFPAMPALAAFTVEAWVRPETGARTGFVAGVNGGPEADCSQGFSLDASAGDFCMSVDPAGCGNVNFRCVEREPDGAWHHLAGSFSNGELRFYIDGELRQEASGLSYDPATHLTAGALQLRAGLQQHYTGEIDDLRIWNHARSQTQIRDHMTRSLNGDEEGLVGYWPMDEGQGQRIDDQSTHARHATLGTTTQPEPSDPRWVQSGVAVCAKAEPEDGVLLHEDFEDGVLQPAITVSRLRIADVAESASGAGIKSTTSIAGGKAFGFGRSSCGASCFNDYQTTLRIDFGREVYISTVGFKYRELFGDWGSWLAVSLDGQQLGSYDHGSFNSGQADPMSTAVEVAVGRRGQVLTFVVTDITSQSEFYVDDILIRGSGGNVATATPTSTPTATPTRTLVVEPTRTLTRSPTHTATPTVTRTVTRTVPSATPTNTRPPGAPVFQDDFEGNDFWDNWSVTGGTWEWGEPGSGPGAAFQGSKLVATILNGNYSENTSGRLVSERKFIVPAAETEPRLRFWHWFNFNCGDVGRVQIRPDGGSWETLIEYGGYSGGTWSRPSLDLSLYAGQRVQIGFDFSSSSPTFCSNTVGPGWYVDELVVVTGVQEAFPINAVEGFEADGFWDRWSSNGGTWQWGGPSTGPGVAQAGESVVATVLGGNYGENTSSRLVSERRFVVPAAATEPRLRFWHWFNFNCGDSGRVQIRPDGGIWETVIEYSGHSGGTWSRPSLDLSLYAGQRVQLGFDFSSSSPTFCSNTVGPGWYVDELIVVAGS